MFNDYICCLFLLNTFKHSCYGVRLSHSYLCSSVCTQAVVYSKIQKYLWIAALKAFLSLISRCQSFNMLCKNEYLYNVFMTAVLMKLLALSEDDLDNFWIGHIIFFAYVIKYTLIA